MTFPVTIAEFQAAVSTSLGPDEIQRLLDAAQEAIESYLGALYSTDSNSAQGQVQELITVHGDLLLLSRRAESIEAVIEWRWSPTTLSADDYELRSDGLTLRRLRTGTHPASSWRGRVDLTYTPLSDVASRELAQIQLARLAITVNPALASYTTGSDSETFAQAKSYDQMRDEILAGLTSANVGVW